MLLASISVLGASLVLASPAFAITGKPQIAWTVGMIGSQASTQSNFSCRYIARPSIGGNGLQIELSNLYGVAPLTINSTTVGVRGTGAGISNATPVRFRGQTTITIPPRSKVKSDPIDFAVTAQQDIAVSLFYPGTTPTLTKNGATQTNSYCTDSNAGDWTMDAFATRYTTKANIVHTVDAVNVYQTDPRGAVVALGASITQGMNSSIDKNTRWTDVLSARFLNSTNPKSVANEGIAGTTACQAAARFNRDVLALSNVTEVLLGGVGGNDFNNGATADQVISCFQSIIDQAHAAGLRVIGGTIPPRPWDATKDGYRVQVNNWMKTTAAFDGVVDFSAVLENPNNPAVLNPSYDSGDGTHPNDAGSAAMANAIPLTLFPYGGSLTANGVGPGTYDDADYWAFSYAGTWSHDAACGVANCYKNTRSWSTAANDNVTLRFSGTQVKLYAIKKSKMGIGAVSIDGGPETNIDLYSASDVRQLVWTSPVLSDAPHEFKLRVTGNKNAGSSDYMVEPDSVDVLGVSSAVTYDDMDYSMFNYVGTGWQHDNTCTYAGIATPNCYNSSKSWSSTTNNYVTVPFQGSHIKLIGAKHPSFGIGAVSIDGGPETNVDFYAPTRMGNQLIWSSPVLPSGAHTLKLRVTGTQGAGSSPTIEPDAVIVTP
jgi:lysophospholipase L1-like esterase